MNPVKPEFDPQGWAVEVESEPISVDKIHEEQVTEVNVQPALYVVPVPIGNLEDVTLRALRILKSVDLVACEDTRSTGQLMSLLGIEPKRLTSYHEHNEVERSEELINLILAGRSVALVSDAGTPCISDPGFRLVSKAISVSIPVIPLPGATAFVPALVASGLASHEFAFVGFPPQKKGRIKWLTEKSLIPMTVIFYESPHRILKLLEQLIHLGCAERRAVVWRELTKKYEERIDGTVQSVAETLAKRAAVKGEIVLVMERFDQIDSIGDIQSLSPE